MNTNKLLNMIISKKNKNFILNENVCLIDVIPWGIRYMVDNFRGRVRSLGIKGKHKKLQCGKKVQLKNKRFIYIDGKIKIRDYVEIDGISENGIQIGKNAIIGKYSIMRASSTLLNLGKGIKIGDNFSCGDYTFFGASGGIEIGNDVIMGQNVRFHAQNHNYEDEKLIRLQGVTRKGIKIGNNCWIGAGVTFLDGVTIGDGCVIGADSVVTKSMPANSVIVGNPAKIIKKRCE